MLLENLLLSGVPKLVTQDEYHEIGELLKVTVLSAAKPAFRGRCHTIDLHEIDKHPKYIP